MSALMSVVNRSHLRGQVTEPISRLMLWTLDLLGSGLLLLLCHCILRHTHRHLADTEELNSNNLYIVNDVLFPCRQNMIT